MKTASLRVVVPTSLSPAITTLEESIRERLLQLQMEEAGGRITPEQLQPAVKATTAFDRAQLEFAPVIRAYTERAKMYDLSTLYATVQMFEDDIRTEMAELDLLTEASFRCKTEDDRADVDRDSLIVSGRLALRRKLLEQTKQSIEQRTEMLVNYITTAFQAEVVAFTGALRSYLDALKGVKTSPALGAVA